MNFKRNLIHELWSFVCLRLTPWVPATINQWQGEPGRWCGKLCHQAPIWKSSCFLNYKRISNDDTLSLSHTDHRVHWLTPCHRRVSPSPPTDPPLVMPANGFTYCDMFVINLFGFCWSRIWWERLQQKKRSRKEK